MALIGGRRMNLILTMAGKYSRFINEGYRLPKYLLPWGSNSIVEEILKNLNKNNDFKSIYLVANKRDDVYMPHLRSIMRSLKIPVENLFLITDTIGQAQTAQLSIKGITNRFGSIEGEICFHNIDTILYGRNIKDIKKALKSCDGLIDIFESNNRNYSYALIENNIVQSIVEKMVISSNATSGLYAFKNAKIFLDNYTNDSLYISEVYQKMIEKNLKIQASKLYCEKDTIVLGTPSEYLTSAYILDL